MKNGKKVLSAIVVALLAVCMMAVMASAADYSVKPGSSVDVVLTESADGIDGKVTCTGGASASYSSSESGGVTTDGVFYLYQAGDKSVTATVTAPAGASAGTKYTVTFTYDAYDANGSSIGSKTVTKTVAVVAAGSDSKDTDSKGSDTETVDSTVDYSKLQAQIDRAVALKQDGYTNDSWKAMTDALAKAQEALTATTQTEVDNATKALSDAIDALKLVDYTELIAAIDKAKALGENDETSAMWIDLLDALTNGDKMLTSGDQAAVDAAAKQINDLIDKLEDNGVTGRFCNIPMHKVWPILFFISLAANVVLVVILVSKKTRKKQNQTDTTPLVDYDINDDE